MRVRALILTQWANPMDPKFLEFIKEVREYAENSEPHEYPIKLHFPDTLAKLRKPGHFLSPDLSQEGLFSGKSRNLTAVESSGYPQAGDQCQAP